MKRTRAIIGVRDVAHSYRWYQALLGILPNPPPTTIELFRNAAAARNIPAAR